VETAHHICQHTPDDVVFSSYSFFLIQTRIISDAPPQMPVKLVSINVQIVSIRNNKYKNYIFLLYIEEYLGKRGRY
jgi:hypothetical protein